MPWFETKATSADGNWGQHWTMATQNPEVRDDTGRRQIASYFYPLIGPYASGDCDVIEYHLLLMKYSGIDGVLLDWYGTLGLYDYPGIKKNAEALIDMLDEVGLKFAIVYEDRTIKAALDAGFITNGITAAQADMDYIASNYFAYDNYITINGKPLLLVFGPEEFHQGSQWTQILSGMTDKPCFLTLHGTSGQTTPNSSGEYIWVDNTPLDNIYATKNNFSVFMGGVYPGFKDFYKAGGWGDGPGFTYDYNDGATFSSGLQKAKTNNVNLLQLITWNDFGEGTMIEPTVEFGYTMLEELQVFEGVSYTKTDLEQFLRLFNLRKNFSGNTSAEKALDQSFYDFVSLRNVAAVAILDSMQTIAGTQ